MTPTPLFYNIQLMEKALRLGWTVLYLPHLRVFAWRRPDCISGESYQSPALLPLPVKMVEEVLAEERSK